MVKKIVIDPGHGGHDPGAAGSGLEEKKINLDIALQMRGILVNYADIILTRDSDKFISLSERAALANTIGADLFVSIHVNAGGGTGFESYIYTSALSETGTIREVIHKEVAAFYAKLEFTDRGLKRAGFAVLRETSMPAVLLENLFIDNSRDAGKLKDAEFRKQVAGAIAQGVIRSLGLQPILTKTPIMAEVKAAKEQIKRALAQENPQADLSIIDHYYLSAPVFGIAPDLAACQAMKETGWFRFGGLVQSWQNNFSGLGATGQPADGNESLNGADSRCVRFKPGVHGVVFMAKEWGVKAHLQHLFAYASRNERPDQILVDPRFALVTRGIAPNYEDLDGRWAVPGIGYGETIVAIRDKIIRDYPIIQEDECDALRLENAVLKERVAKAVKILTV